MTGKTFLFATAMMAGTLQANAADTVLAEPEPAENVRVCDAYGAGFFYIPGTETCLQISGYVWFQVGAESFEDDGDTPDFFSGGSFTGKGGFVSSAVGRLNIDARSNTEFGTLRSFIRLESDFIGYNSADGELSLDEAFLELGGLRAGYTESAWLESQRAGIAQDGSHSWGGLYYGNQQRDLIAYTIGSEEGLAATLSLEDDGQEGGNYVPDVVGVVTYNQKWGAVWAKAGFDEDRGGTGHSGFALQAGLAYLVPFSEGSSLRVIGYYADSDNAYGTGHTYSYFTGGYGNSEWSVLGSYFQKVSEKFGGSLGVQYFGNFYDGAFSDQTSDLDGYAVELSLVYLPVTNLEVRTEVQYDKIDTYDGTVSGFLRFTRFF